MTLRLAITLRPGDSGGALDLQDAGDGTGLDNRGRTRIVAWFRGNFERWAMLWLLQLMPECSERSAAS